MWWQVKIVVAVLCALLCADNGWCQIAVVNPYATPLTNTGCSANCGQGATIGQCAGNFAGIRARANKRAFQYLSSILRDLINREVSRATIPPINECLPGPLLTGCIQAYNLYVSRYRPPRNVAVYPSIPNKIAITIQDVDIGLTGNLGGQVNILLPVPISGIVQATVYGLSITAEVVIDKSPQCTLCMRVVGCTVTYRYLDVCIQNGGLLGDMANGPFRSQINSMVGQRLPAKLCSMVPQLVNQKVNPKLAQVPNRLSVAHLFSLVSSSVAGGRNLQCSTVRQQCHGTTTLLQATPLRHQSLANSVIRTNQTKRHHSNNYTVRAEKLDLTAELQNINYLNELLKDGTVVKGLLDLQHNKPQTSASADLHRSAKTSSTSKKSHMNVNMAPVVQGTYKATTDNKNNHTTEKLRVKRDTISSSQTNSTQHFAKSTVNKFNVPPSRPTLPKRYDASTAPVNGKTPQQMQQISNQSRTLIQKVPVKQSSAEQRAIHQTVSLTNKRSAKAHHEIFVKDSATLKNVSSVTIPPKFINKHSFTGKNNERAKARGCATSCANAVGNTVSKDNPCAGCPGVNTYTDPLASVLELFKNLDISKLCNIYMNLDLLGTYATCCDYSIAISGTFSYCNQLPPICPGSYNFPPNANTNAMLEIVISDYTINSFFHQLYRSGALSIVIGPQTPKIGSFLRTTCDDSESAPGSNSNSDDLFICIGDILPAFSSRYPHQTIAARIYILAPPQVNMYSRGASGGCANLNINIGIDLCISAINQCYETSKLGTVEVSGSADVCTVFHNSQVYGSATVNQLSIVDNQQTLGMNPKALKQFSVVGKELLGRLLNDALAKGIPINPSVGSLPISFQNAQVTIINHAVYIATDFQFTSLPQI